MGRDVQSDFFVIKQMQLQCSMSPIRDAISNFLSHPRRTPHRMQTFRSAYKPSTARVMLPKSSPRNANSLPKIRHLFEIEDR